MSYRHGPMVLIVFMALGTFASIFFSGPAALFVMAIGWALSLWIVLAGE